MSSGALLSAAEYSSLSAAVGVHTEVLARRIATHRLADFKVTELKEILKWLRTNPNWQVNPAVHQRPPASDAGSTGKKQLIDHLRSVLQTQQQITSGSTDMNQMGGVGGGDLSTMQLQQAQYRAQQQQAQAAAARFQANNDPYRYPNPNAGRPMTNTHNTYVQSPYGQQPHQQQQQQPQQFAYTNGTHHTQYGGAAQPRTYAPQAPNGAYASPYATNAYGTHPHPSHPSVPAPSPSAAKSSELSQLLSCPSLLRHRSPYEQVVQPLARNLLNATSHTPSQSTGAPGGAHHTTLTFTMNPAYLSRVKRANRPVPPGSEHQLLEVHLRLFSAINLDHTMWDKKFRVIVNGHEVPIPEPKKLSKTKKKGLELVRGLDISELVQAHTNTIEVSVYRQSYSVELFRGVVLADLVRIRDTSELMDQFRKTIKDEESKMQATALERSCVICHSKKDPLRCSRCKNEWYCLADDHQLLTSDGFIGLDAVESALGSGSDLKFATLNQHGFMEFQSAQRLIIHPAQARDMIEVTQLAEKQRWTSHQAEVADIGPLAVASPVDAAPSTITGVSLLVTPEHDMWFAPTPSKGLDADLDSTDSHRSLSFAKHQAALLLTADEDTRVQFQAAAPAGVWQSEEDARLPFVDALALRSQEQVDAFIALYGFWTLSGFNRLASPLAAAAVCFRSESSMSHSWLQRQLLASRLDACDYTRTETADGRCEYAVTHAGWVSYFHSLSTPLSIDAATLADPCIPPTAPMCAWVWQLKKDRLRSLLSGAHQAGGAESLDGSCHIIIDDAQLRDDLVRVCLLAGYGAMFVRSPDTDALSASPRWLVQYRDDATNFTIHNSTEVSKVTTYFGRVWCVQVPNGLLFARRAQSDPCGVVVQASRPTIVGNCGAEHQRAHWSIHREKCAVPTAEQDAQRESHEKRAAQLAMLGKNGRTKLVMPVKVKHEADGTVTHEPDDDDDECEEVDALVSLKCPLSLERYEYPARGRHCGHLPCFNLETYLMFSQQSGVWQCPVCYKGLPVEEIEINLQMAAILRETDSETTQIRVHPDGEYDPIKAIPDGDGDGRDASRKRKQAATATPPPPPAKVQVTAAGAVLASSPNQSATVPAASPTWDGAAPLNTTLTVPYTGEVASTSASPPQVSPPPAAHAPLFTPSASPPPQTNSVAAATASDAFGAGTADEPIELD